MRNQTQTHKFRFKINNTQIMSQTTPMTTFDASVELNQSVEKQMAAAMAVSTTRMVEFLASEYGFNAAEAVQRLGLDSVSVNRSTKKKAAKGPPRGPPKEKRMVPSIPLPFCGIVKENWCCGLRLNHGLYSQCNMPKGNDTDFCKTCVKQVEKNENNKPTYGVIQDRMAVGTMEFRDPKGKAVVCYGNVMAKLKIGKETAIAEAAKFGLVIEEEQFEVRQTMRGRPKKDATASDTESEKSDKKRGRPRASKKAVAAAVGDNMIAALVAQAHLTGVASDGSESDGSVKSAVSDVSAVSVVSAVSTDSTKAKKAKDPKPELTEEEKAAKKAASAAKRAATIAAKPELTEEEKAAKKAASAAKRAATWAAKAAKKAEDAKPAAIIGVSVPADPVANIVEAVAGPPLVPPIFQAELVEEAVSDSDDDDDEEVVMQVEKFTHDGVTYLKPVDENADSGAVLYDMVSNEPVGVWNVELKKVDQYDASMYEE